ncbi:mechanosensitive ion channel [Cyanobacterium stanieri]|nr:mechanosensitive ion channel [Cyanobacterium stanieri]
MDSLPDLNALSLFAQISEVQENLPVPDDLVSALLSLGKAILILIIGLIFANIFKGFIRKSLHKTDIDNRLASFIMGDNAEDAKKIETEKWISETVGWVIILFVVVAFLNALELDLVSEPLNALLNEVMSFLPSLGGAAIILVVAWLLATVVKLIIVKTLSQFHFDEKLNQQVQDDNEMMDDAQGGEIAIGETIGNALFWFIILLFLPSILGILGLDGTLRPLEELVNDILGVVPNVFAAAIIAFIGWIVAQVVKKVVSNLLKASGADAIGAKFGMSTTNKKQSLSYVIGSVVYVLILIPIAITALDALEIQAISVPAIAMLDQVLDILPKLFAAIVVLGFGYFGAQYLAELLVNLLTNVGFNNVFVWLGITETAPVAVGENSEEENNTKTPAQIVGIILVIAIMLVATITAVDILQIEALREVVAFISLLAGQVLIGVIIFAVGLYFANLVYRLVINSGTQQAQFLAQVARIAIIVLVAAMALERIGIAPNIVNLAFGLLTGGIAVAIALAFGLGGREAAGNALQRWLDSFTNGGSDS